MVAGYYSMGVKSGVKGDDYTVSGPRRRLMKSSGSFLKKGNPISDPKLLETSLWGPQKRTLKFGKPPSLRGGFSDLWAPGAQRFGLPMAWV